MELPKIGSSEGGIFDGLKSKLGFGSKNDHHNDGYDEYDDYDDAGYDDYDEGGYDDYDSYDNRGSYANDYDDRSSRNSSRDSYDDRSSRSSYDRQSGSGGVTRPRLVSIDDVRANTQLDIDTHSDWNSRASEGASADRGAFDFETSSRELRSEGLNSLLTPTTDSFSQPAEPQPAPEKPAVISPLSEQPTLRPAGLSYEAFSAVSARQSTGPAPRLLTVLKPQAYGDVARMAKTVRTGDVAVLCLTAMQEALSKRILDFSFGVASAFDARVDCVGNMVFAICVGDALSVAELQDLKNQGVL